MRKLAAAGLMSLSLLLPLGVSAAFNSVDSGLNTTAGTAYGPQVISDQSNIGVFIGTFIIKPVLGLLGLLFLCLTVYAGGLWMTAAGNPKRVEKAKDILVAAVIGAVIVVAAYSLTNALFNALSTGSISGCSGPQC
jgi:predicted secreted protein